MEFEFTWIESSRVKALADHSRLDTAALNLSEIKRIVDLRVKRTRAIGMCTALVVGPRSPARYGLARMVEAFVASQSDEPVKVFETFDEGMAWLRSLDSPSPSEPRAEDGEAVGDPAL